MDKEQKKLVLNGIDNYCLHLERNLKYLRQSCEFGLHKGKLGLAEQIQRDAAELADLLETYLDESFTLNDLQDYRDWKN